MKTIIKNKKRAFSLVEVMMTLLILSIVMVLMAPVITKKVTMRKTEGIVYTYKDSNVDIENKCFALNEAGDTLYSTRNCSEYTFTPPKGVTAVNLTLVAGGGGGGGAAGGKLETLLTTAKASPLTDKLQNVTINYLTAKGQTGGSANSGCAGGTDSICAGSGGMSSSAILNFSIPDSLYRTVPNIIYDANAKSSIAISIDNTEATKTAEISLPKIAYRVKGPISSTDAGAIECTTDDTTYKTSDGGFSRCLLPSQNILASKKGDAGFYLRKASYSSAYIGKVLQGGLGGFNTASAYNSYGAGGKGASYTINTCNASTCSGTSGTAQAGSNGHASVSYTLEHAGGIGGGGAGGSAVKILAFPVDSSKEYIIRVGKGGNGGAGGVTGANATPGVSGEAGSTTSIWEKTDSGETLLFMVVGGAPGYGGKIIANLSDEKGNPGPSGRNYPTFIYATSMQNLALDAHVSQKTTGAAIAVPTTITGASSSRISYPYLTDSTNNANQPYKAMNDNNPGNNTANTDGKTGGYHAFNTGNLNYIQIAQLNSNTKESAYDGFYYRTVIGKEIAYPGGLGGFSGLGTKAGCGGLFAGNVNGRTQKSVTNPDNTITTTNDNDNTYINKFLIPAVTGTAYEVNNYYGNCSLSTPNGQTAKFILPDAATSALGQAGSGGGGGGYVMFQAPGKGGDGQNGYLMINWRR